jgi:hypothetical protein
MIPLVIILTVNSITVSLNISYLLFANIPLVLYILKTMLDIKHVAENVHLFLPNNNCHAEPYTQYDIHLDANALTDGELKLLLQWSRGLSVKQLDVHPMILNRLLRKYVKETLKQKQQCNIDITHSQL